MAGDFSTGCSKRKRAQRGREGRRELTNRHETKQPVDPASRRRGQTHLALASRQDRAPFHGPPSRARSLGPKLSVECTREPDYRLMVDGDRNFIRNLDGTETYVTYLDQIEDDEFAYAEPGGKAYHTRAGCYRTGRRNKSASPAGISYASTTRRRRGMLVASARTPSTSVESRRGNPLGYGLRGPAGPRGDLRKKGKPEARVQRTDRPQPGSKVENFAKATRFREGRR